MTQIKLIGMSIQEARRFLDNKISRTRLLGKSEEANLVVGKGNLKHFVSKTLKEDYHLDPWKHHNQGIINVIFE
jgi:hypothetical protein